MYATDVRQTDERQTASSLGGGITMITTTSCRRAAATVCPAPLLPPWAPKRLPPTSRRQHSSSFPRPTRSHAHRCSRLTRQHGGDLLTLTCDVGYLCANFSLPRPLYSRVRPDVRDRQTDVRQMHRLMPPPIRGGGIITLVLSHFCADKSSTIA